MPGVLLLDLLEQELYVTVHFYGTHTFGRIA